MSITAAFDIPISLSLSIFDTKLFNVRPRSLITSCYKIPIDILTKPLTQRCVF